MKRYFLFFTLAMMTIVSSCKKEPAPDNGNEGNTDQPPVNYPQPDQNVPYVLEGTIKTEGFSWAEGASIGIYGNMEELRIINKECTIEEASVGQAVGRFTTPGIDLVKGQNKLFAYTPYNADLSYVEGMIYGLTISDGQVQDAPNVALNCFSVANFTGVPKVDETFKFELLPVTAVAQVTLTTSTLQNYKPKTVTIWDDTNTPMAGGFNINVNTMEVSLLDEGQKSKVAVTVTNPVDFTTTATQNFYVQILPGDYSNKELWIQIDLEDADGKITTIPVKKSGLVFEAGKTTLIDLSGLSLDMNDAEWYAAGETRYLAGNAVAYGEANTYLIQCKNGTYKGASYVANADIPNEVVIDYRARGNFSNAVAPVGVTFEWAQNSAGLYTPRINDYGSSNVVIKDQFTYTHNPENFTVTVKNNGAYAGAPILLMKKDGKILWAWAFWNIAADGTTLTPVTVGDYQFAPMDIGQPTTNAEKWIANKHSDGSTPDVMFRMHHYYQFGRPIPIFWTPVWSLDGADFANSSLEHATGKGNVPAIPAPVTFEQHLANPVGFIIKTDLDQTAANWCTTPLNDMWGTNDREKEGTKSIYDPCPKGWRLPSYKAMTTLASQTSTWDTTDGNCHVSAGGLKIVLSGRIAGKRSSGSKYGAPSNMGGGNSGKIANCKHAALWSNVAGDVQGQALYIEYNADATHAKYRTGTFDLCQANAVRCIVDTDNR